MRPYTPPCLSHLRHLTIQYTDVDTCEDAAYLYKWLRWVASRAPLESLHLICDDVNFGAVPTFDPLIEHMCAKHAETLRVLVIPGCYVGQHALKALCASCTELEELSVLITTDTLVRALTKC